MTKQKIVITLIAVVTILFIITRAQTSNAPKLDIDRDDTQITVTNLSLGSEGAKTYLSNRNCKEGFKTSIFYGPVEGFVETLSEGAKLLSSMVVIETPDTETADNKDRVQLYNASNVSFSRPRCIEEEERLDDPIRLEQGRTTILGESLVLEPDDNVGDMRGPITLERAAEGESPSLSAQSDELQFDFDTDLSTLSGNVTITSEDRVSTADVLEYDEANGVAIMRGNPARSTQGDDFVEGSVIRYFLNNNDVMVVGGINGEIEVDLD